MIRNKDAHGEPIAKDKLKNELDKRQKLINEIVKDLNFIQEYELILPEKLEIEDSQPIYYYKIFKGNETITKKGKFNFSPTLNDVILLDKNQEEIINLSPYILYLGIEHLDKNFLGIFSSYMNKEQTQA